MKSGRWVMIPILVMQHVAYRVILDGVVTFSHLGDAGPKHAIYASQYAETCEPTARHFGSPWLGAH